MAMQPTRPPASLFPSIGRWSVTAIPEGWNFIPGFGIRQANLDPNAVAANVCLGQDKLKAQDGLLSYIERQKELIEDQLPGVKFSGPVTSHFRDSEAQLMTASHGVPEVGTIVHVQTYVRADTWLGVVTLTAREEEIPAVRLVCDAFLTYLLIQPEPAPEGLRVAGPHGIDGEVR
jgi:hypothetical protein